MYISSEGVEHSAHRRFNIKSLIQNNKNSGINMHQE